LCEWELYFRTGLPRDTDTGTLPIDITEVHIENVAGTQSQSRHQQDRGAIPQPDSGIAITSSDHALDISRWQVARQ
jgi:hypothetical protein